MLNAYGPGVTSTALVWEECNGMECNGMYDQHDRDEREHEHATPATLQLLHRCQ